ncbi:hypothetical protein KW522_02965 [Vibrio fluvialis]|nr:hypothetical protein [Vibrio fluvialis]MBY8170250.1 hypothetical protein [Vibrio fluvialis]MBY8234774.1 hypothetical protein [Vibrio fluvialis]
MFSRISNFDLHLICECLESGQNWSGYRGYLDEEMQKWLLKKRMPLCRVI